MPVNPAYHVSLLQRAGTLAGLMLMAATAAAIAAEPPALEITVAQRAALRVGDRLPLTVAARGGDDGLWGELQVVTDPDGPWVVVDGPHGLAGAQPPAWELVLSPIKTGDLTLPRMVTTVREAGAEAREVATAEPPSVTVGSVLPESDDVQPIPLRDPVGVSGFPWEWVLPLAVPALGMAAGLLWWSRRRRVGMATDGMPALPPLTELESLLEQLEQRIGRDPLEGVCDRLAAGLRRYLARQSGAPAEDMTSFELRLLARRLGWADGVQRGVQEVMAVADRVRFARVPADEQRLRRTIDEARATAREIDRLVAAATAATEAAAATSEAAG